MEWWRRLLFWRQYDWKQRGEARGRTGPPDSAGDAHRAKAEPEASLSIKVIRADGSVEHYDTSAQITPKEN